MELPMRTGKNNWQDVFSRGHLTRAWHYLGCHADSCGHVFRVWAPNARSVCLMGDFNGWNESSHPMYPIGYGIWEISLPGLHQYDTYKYAIHGQDGRITAKSDPYAFHAETRPANASKIYDLRGYSWGDSNWLNWRHKNPVYHRPLNIYEVHLGSWRRGGEGEFLSYREIARYLVPYVKEMGFTHVEFLPITEHPLDTSWGYQCTGYFAATSRFGTPHDLMYLIDQLHQAGVGVILDWVPAHFPRDSFGLFEFDGSPTYEYSDPRKSDHADWGTRIFDYGKHEVRSFLLSSALFWLEEFHFDGLRVDAVASMLYLDYGKQQGSWVPNIHGGTENLEAVEFLRLLNTEVFSAHPDVLMIAEESTAWPGVSHPADTGGLGFNLKWNMGWANDILHYIKLDPYFRQFNHKDVTFSLSYAFSENFILPISHDEVVHMKGSLINKMPGDDLLKFAGVRAFYLYMLAHPGKKLTMMGSEFGQWNEWHYEHSLDWHLLEMDNEDGARHRTLQSFIKEANSLYLREQALWAEDFSSAGFRWLYPDDSQGNCISFLRFGLNGQSPLAVVCNFSPVFRGGYRIGVPLPGTWEVILNSDDPRFGGTGASQTTEFTAQPHPLHAQGYSLQIDLPPMSSLILRSIHESDQEVII